MLRATSEISASLDRIVESVAGRLYLEGREVFRLPPLCVVLVVAGQAKIDEVILVGIRTIAIDVSDLSLFLPVVAFEMGTERTASAAAV